jgi:anti-anti-sigma factor
MEIIPLGERLVKVVFAGRLDTQGVDLVETRVMAALAPGANNAIVDLSQVDFVASMGIRMLVSLTRTLKARRADVALFGAQERVTQVFEAVALGKIMTICSTETDALAAVASTRSMGA